MWSQKPHSIVNYSVFHSGSSVHTHYTYHSITVAQQMQSVCISHVKLLNLKEDCIFVMDHLAINHPQLYESCVHALKGTKTQRQHGQNVSNFFTTNADGFYIKQ